MFIINICHLIIQLRLQLYDRISLLYSVPLFDSIDFYYLYYSYQSMNDA